MGFDFEIVEIHAAKDYASIGGRRNEAHAAADGGVQTDAFGFDGTLNCDLEGHASQTPYYMHPGALSKLFLNVLIQCVTGERGEKFPQVLQEYNKWGRPSVHRFGQEGGAWWSGCGYLDVRR